MPEPEPEPARFALPSWAPEERVISSALVLLVTLLIALMAGLGARGSAGVAPQHAAPPPSDAAMAAPPAPQAAAPALQTSPISDAPEDAGAASPPPIVAASAPTEPPMVAMAIDTPTPEPPPADGSLLPTYRIVTYYGHPHDEHMGIIGEFSKDEIAQRLQTEAANYEAADPSRPVLTAFELIATVAQRDPGPDGTYILDTDMDTLKEYVDYAADHNMLVFLDLQIGRGTVAAEIEKVRPLLERPNVHLAIDPEFAIGPGEIPGENIGSVPAESITYAQQYLAKLSHDLGLPPKILIVHQFREDMIGGKDQLAPVPGVQLVIDADGYGEPELKTQVYNILVRDQPVQFGGIKLFYKQDHPLMTAAEILALKPAPDVIIYQ
ncbi:MAG TPA: hypothetical protein VFU81_03690 [Thermomicrobiales bacterium]|nr:hypothetical protein [Thermomicrobiales bacterium]